MSFKNIGNPYATSWLAEQKLKTPSYNEEQARISRVREKFPLYKMPKIEALDYAAKMGASDTARGIAQVFGKGGEYFGVDGLTKKLKEKDDKLRAIFNSEEYGTEALVTFLSTAIVADPATYVPIVGWLSKGKKAKNLWDITKYGAGAGAIIAGLGYSPEDSPQLLSKADAPFIQKRLENILIGGTAGGTLTAFGGKVIDKIQIARGKGSIFGEADEVRAVKSANDRLSAVEEEVATKGTLELGQIIRSPDKNNIGTIMDLDEDLGIATVRFVNKANGTSATKKFYIDELRPNKVNKAKPIPQKKLDAEVERPTQVVFTVDETSNPLTNIYRTKNRETGEIYSIKKAIDENGKVIKGQWEVIVSVERKVKSKKDNKIYTKERVISEEPVVLGSLEKAKSYVKNKIKPDQGKPKSLEDFGGTVVEQSAKDKKKNKTARPINDFYRKYFGNPAWRMIQNNPGETGAFGVGFISGRNSIEDDPNQWLNFERWKAGMKYGLIAAGGVKGIKKVDKNFFNGRGSEFFSSQIISDYGLTTDYLKVKRNAIILKNDIQSQFLDIVNKAKKELNEEQNKLLWAFMSGEFFDVTKLSKNALQINAEGRTLITKYAQQLVDLNLLDEKVFRKNINTYLKKSYLKHSQFNNPFKKKKETQEGLTKESVTELRILGDELRPRGWTEEVTLKKFRSNPKYREEGWEIIKRGGKDKTKLTIRRQFTKEERIEMGEIENAAYAIRETGRLLANDVSTMQFFNKLFDEKLGKASVPELEGLVITEKNWKALPREERAKFVRLSDANIKGTDRPKFGNLGGKYVDKYVANDLKVTYNMAEEGEAAWKPIIRTLNDIQRFWKKTKTAYNPATHTGNFVSNIMLLDFAEVEFKYLLKAIKTMNQGDKNPLNREADIAGIYDVNLLTKELNNIGSEIEKALIKSIDTPKGSDISFYKYVPELWKAFKKVPDLMEKAYIWEDSVFRLATYMDRLDKGLPVEEAAVEARKWFIDYDINAPLINKLKNTVVPFISYSYRVIPLLAESAVLRPHKFAKWAAIIGGADLAGQAITSEDYGKLSRHLMKESYKKTLFGLDIMPYTTVKLPFDSETGEEAYIDISRMIPGGDIYELREDGKSGLPGVPVPFQPGGLWWDFGYMLITGEDPFTGQELEDPEGKRFWNVMKATGQKAAPNIFVIPGTYNNKKLEKAIRTSRRGEKGYRRTEESPYSADIGIFEALAFNLGIRLRPQSIPKNKTLRAQLFDQEEAKLRKAQSQLEKDRRNERISQEDFEKEEAELHLMFIRHWAERELYDDRTSILEIERDKKVKGRVQKFKGGTIHEDYPVPNVKKEPSEMINKATGQPYEAEMERLGMEDGGLLVSIGVAPVSEKQINKLKNKLKERKAKRDGGEIRQQYAFGDRIKKALKRRGEAELLRQKALTNAPSYIRDKVLEATPTSIKTYVDKVVLGNREAITEKDFKENQMRSLDTEITNKVRRGIKSGEYFLTEDGQLKTIRNQDGKIGSKSNKDNGYFIDLDTKYLDKEGDIFRTIGSSGVSISKEKPNYNIVDEYDFAFEFAGEPTARGFNKDNIEQYRRADEAGRQEASNAKLDWRGNKILNYALPLAERYGAGQLPDELTATQLSKLEGKEVMPESVNINIGSALNIAENEWAELMEQANTNRDNIDSWINDRYSRVEDSLLTPVKVQGN